MKETKIKLAKGLGVCGGLRWIATADNVPVYVEGWTRQGTMDKFVENLNEYLGIIGQGHARINRILVPIVPKGGEPCKG